MVTQILHRAAVAAGISVVAALMITPLAGAQPATGAAATSQGVMCKDGTMSAKAGRGACRGHGGMAKHAKAHGSAPTTTKSMRSTEHMSHGASESSTTAPSPPAGRLARSAPPASTMPMTGARGSGVWVNSSSKVYHCPGDRWYGKTKHGQYMSEADAKAQGYRPDHGKGCT